MLIYGPAAPEEVTEASGRLNSNEHDCRGGRQAANTREVAEGISELSDAAGICCARMIRSKRARRGDRGTVQRGASGNQARPWLGGALQVDPRFPSTRNNSTETAARECALELRRVPAVGRSLLRRIDICTHDVAVKDLAAQLRD